MSAGTNGPDPRPAGTEPLPSAQVRDFLAGLAPSPDPWAVDVATLRADTRARVLAVTGEAEPVASVEPIDAGGVPARIYRTRGQEAAALVWAHGGAWIHGDLDTADGVARALANRSGCAVVSVDYRLAPEHPFPAGFDDMWSAVEWAGRSFPAVAVGGDSSGGNLAAAAALKARDTGVPLAAQLLVYPVLDSTEDTAYKRRFTQRYANFAGQPGFGPNADQRLRHVWQTYVPDRTLRRHPYASPLHATTLRGVAPTILITAEHDFLRGEAEDYARRLRAADVPVHHDDYAGQIHGFFEMFTVFADSHHAVGVAGEALSQAFSHSAKEFSCDR